LLIGFVNKTKGDPMNQIYSISVLVHQERRGASAVGVRVDFPESQIPQNVKKLLKQK